MIQVLDSVDSCNIFWVQVAGEINDLFSCVSIIFFLVCPLPRKYVAIAGLAKELMEIQK